jgi:DNA-binding response OmpR family regulator
VRILVVEDDDRVADAMRDGLAQRGYHAARAATGAEAVAACEGAQPPDLVLLDLGLPDVDGADLCVRLRRRSGVPVIVVTARGDLPSRVQGLRRGADDYVVKPFSLAELLARIEAVLRRTHAAAPGPESVVTVGDVEIDLSARRVTVAGEPVALTRKEFEILAALARAPGAAVDRQRLLVEVWETDWAGMSRTLDVHVATLRSKLGRPDVVQTVRGVGYRLATDLPPE